ncbi:MAG: ketoacyl-ACP synthase III [Deltaproteobacteria bacterium]|nr:MAG: ketoacyl-ACP synthase III [Deltaproteobacteria bacterium]
MLDVSIVGTAMYAPERVETAADLAPRIGRSERWIERRTGVLRRHISDEPMNVMAARVVREVLGDGPPPDLLVNASLTPLQLIPDSSVFILEELGLSGIASFSVHGTCLSFLLGLHTAASLVHSGAYKRVVVVSSEQGSVCRDFDQPESAALIGDGAGAAIIEPATRPGQGILGFAQQTFPDGAELTELRGCGTRHHPNDPATTDKDNLFQMQGPNVYKMALRRVPPIIGGLLEQAGLRPQDIDVVVPHQPSGPGMKAYEKLGFHPDQIVNIIDEYGNCIAASLPMALATADRAGRLRRGDLVMMLGTGAGLSIAGMILRW